MQYACHGRSVLCCRVWFCDWNIKICHFHVLSTWRLSVNWSSSFLYWRPFTIIIRHLLFSYILHGDVVKYFMIVQCIGLNNNYNSALFLTHIHKELRTWFCNCLLLSAQKLPKLMLMSWWVCCQDIANKNVMSLRSNLSGQA